MLTVPAPMVPSPPLTLQKPVEIRLTGLAFSDGAPVARDESISTGVLVFRGAPGGGDVWDDARKVWRAIPADDQLMEMKPVPAAAGDIDWKATVIALGQKDASGAAVYEAASGGAPSYYARGLAKAVRPDATEERGLSAPSAAFTFSSATDARFTADFDTPSTQPDQAHRVRMQLKGDGLQPAGYIEIRATPSFEVEIANCDGAGTPLATVLLRSDGAIRLAPAAGQRVVIDGDAETGRLLYAPAGGGPKLWLA